MNAYKRIAEEYFRRMEGWQLYPKGRLLWIWVVLSVGWVAALIWVIPVVMHGTVLSWRFALVLGLEALLLLATDKIADHKRAALVGMTRKVSLVEVNETRRRTLCGQVAADPSQFLSIAKEISELTATRTKFRQASDFDHGFFLRRIYDPDSKARILAILLAGLTLCTALAIRTIELPSLFEALEGDGAWRFLGALMSVSVALYLLFVGAQALSAVIWTALTTWTAKTFKSSASDTTLRYLVRDLVLLYEPKHLVKIGRPQSDGEPPTAIGH